MSKYVSHKKDREEKMHKDKSSCGRYALSIERITPGSVSKMRPFSQENTRQNIEIAQNIESICQSPDEDEDDDEEARLDRYSSRSSDV
jgi:hypothetical protein